MSRLGGLDTQCWKHLTGHVVVVDGVVSLSGRNHNSWTAERTEKPKTSVVQERGIGCVEVDICLDWKSQNAALSVPDFRQCGAPRRYKVPEATHPTLDTLNLRG